MIQWKVLVSCCAGMAGIVNCGDLRAEPVVASIDAAVELFVEDGAIAGAVTMLVQHGNTVHLSAVGVANRETQTPMQPDSLFAIASMTKPITATALMMLVEEGKLGLDDPVEKYLPAFACARTDRRRQVRCLTIRRLLTHTSGLVGKQSCEVSLAATAEMLARRPFGFQPGTRWEYGPGLNVCGRIIEVASGQAYEDFLAERIFEPLAMQDTTFFPTDAQRPRIAELYELKPTSDAKDAPQVLAPGVREFATGLPDSVPNPSGGLYSTAQDMAKFYTMILAGGSGPEGSQLVSQASVAEMLRLQTGRLKTGFTPGNGWGLGWCLIREPQGVTGMLSSGAFGHGGLFGTQGWIDPQRQAIFILMIQRQGLPNSDGSEIRAVFQQAAAEALR